MGDMLYGFALGLTDGLFFQKDHFAPQMGAGERGKTPAFAEASSFASPFATGRLRRTRWRAGEILKKILSYLDADYSDDADCERSLQNLMRDLFGEENKPALWNPSQGVSPLRRVFNGASLF